MKMIYSWLEAPARLLMALLFLVSATTKVTETSDIQAYMNAFGLQGILVWPAAAGNTPQARCSSSGFGSALSRCFWQPGVFSLP